MAFHKNSGEASEAGLAHLRGSRVKETNYEQLHVGPQTKQSQTKQNMEKSFPPIFSDDSSSDSASTASEKSLRTESAPSISQRAPLNERRPQSAPGRSRASRWGRGRR